MSSSSNSIDAAVTTDVVAARPPGRPRNAGADQTILEATWAEVAAQGLAGLSLDKVAARAGVSKATIYRRWPSKEALVLDAWRRADGGVVTCPDTGSLRSDLQAMHHAMIEHFEYEPLAILLPQMVAAGRQNPELAKQFAEFIEEERGPIRELLARAQRRGEIAATVDLELIIGLMMGQFLTVVLFENRMLTAEETKASTEALLVGIAGPNLR